LYVALEATKAVPTKDKNDTILYYSLQDPYRIWFEVDSVWDTLSHPLPLNPGEKLCRLSVAGLINAMSGIEGGVVDATCSSSLSAEEDVMALTSHSLGDIREIASLIHETTVSYACLDKDQSSLSAEKQQSYKPIIYPDSSEDESGSSIHLRVRRSRKTSICKVCDNTKEYLLVFDTKKGGLICTSCGGTIACEDDNRMIHQKKKQKYQHSHYQTGGVFNHNGVHNKTSIYQQ